MKPDMTEAGDTPAKASRTAHLGHTNAYTRHLMRHHEPPMEEDHEKTKKWEWVPRSEGSAGATTPTVLIPVAAKALHPVRLYHPNRQALWGLYR